MFHGVGSYAFIMGIISGYPVGAKIVNKFVEDGSCSKTEAERLLALSNNSGPLFIIGTVGISLFGDVNIGILLFATHILACLTVGIIFGAISKQHFFEKRQVLLSLKRNSHSSSNNMRNEGKSNSYGIADLGTILSVCISNAISTILLIGGFVVLFSIVISILNKLNIISTLAELLTIFGISKNCGIGILTRFAGINKWCKPCIFSTFKMYVYSNYNLCFFIRRGWAFNIFASF